MGNSSKLSPDIAAAAASAGAGAKAAMAPAPATPAKAPVFDIAAEAKATAHGKTTLSPDQKKEYDKVLALYEKAGDRMGSPTWSAADQRNLTAFKTELKAIEKMPEADRTAVLGKLMYHGAHLGGKGEGMLADIINQAPSSKQIQFTDQKHNNVSFEAILKEGINVNTSDVQSTRYNVEPDANRWASVQATAVKAHQLEVRDAKAAGRHKE